MLDHRVQVGEPLLDPVGARELQEVAGHVLRVTNTAKAPWIIVEGTDDA